MPSKCFICNGKMSGRGKGGDLHRHNGSAHTDCLWRASRDYMKIKNVVTGIPITVAHYPPYVNALVRRTDDNKNTQ